MSKITSSARCAGLSTPHELRQFPLSRLCCLELTGYRESHLKTQEEERKCRKERRQQELYLEDLGEKETGKRYGLDRIGKLIGKAKKGNRENCLCRSVIVQNVTVGSKNIIGGAYCALPPCNLIAPGLLTWPQKQVLSSPNWLCCVSNWVSEGTVFFINSRSVPPDKSYLRKATPRGKHPPKAFWFGWGIFLCHVFNDNAHHHL